MATKEEMRARHEVGSWDGKKRGANRIAAAGAPTHDDELLASSSAWAAHTSPHHIGQTIASEQLLSTALQDQHPTAPFTNGVASDPPASDDDDFDFVDSDQPFPSEADDNTGRSTGSLASLAAASRSHIARQYSKYRSRVQPSSTNDEDWDTLPGASETGMEAGGENDYHSPDWHQAGRNADTTDTAGPGEHGLLQCTVTKPQKEGEGTQNAYISYLVTTDVCINIWQDNTTSEITR